jgi:GT2 family glycosyltransferase
MISVLLPTYNQAAFLPDALAGLARQTRREFELIACDDGSTDGTADILRAHGVKTVTHPVNRGTAAAINSAFAASDPRSEFVTWVSSDNVMLPAWLQTMRSAIRGRGNFGAVYSAYQSVGKSASPGVKNPRPKVIRPGGHQYDRLIEGENCYFGPSFLIRREVWQEHRGGTAHDYDNWLRVEEACRLRGLALGYVPDVLCEYRHGDWNTARRRPDLYDAPKWRAHAVERRALTRNWLGDLVAAHVRPDDEVLDLGCGVMPATGGRLPCRRHVGVDCFEPYLDRIGPPTVLADLPRGLESFAAGSFDVVLMLDVIEHLDKPAAMELIRRAERIARREVILFTPDGFVEQRGWPAWNLPDNPAQTHRCGFAFDELIGMGYECTRYPSGSLQAGPIVAVMGAKTIACG